MRGIRDSLGLHARRFRALLMHRFHGWLFMIALGLVAAAVTLLLDGDTVSGISVTVIALSAIWLAGIWPWPWGMDRYVLRVSDVLQAGSREANSASCTRRASLRTLRTMIEQVDPPLDCIGTQQEIVDRMEEVDYLEAEDKGSLADRAIRMNAIRSDLISALVRLSAWQSDSEVNRLAQLGDQLLRDMADTRRATEAPLEEMAERLRKIAVPRGWKGKHSRCESVLGTYLVALRRFNNARESEDNDAMQRAAQELSVEQVAMEKSINQYLDDLRANYQGVVCHVEASQADS